MTDLEAGTDAISVDYTIFREFGVELTDDQLAKARAFVVRREQIAKAAKKWQLLNRSQHLAAVEFDKALPGLSRVVLAENANYRPGDMAHANCDVVEDLAFDQVTHEVYIPVGAVVALEALTKWSVISINAENKK